MPDRIYITLNGKKVAADNRETLLSVCNRESVHIPTFCHHPRLEPYGVCRVCLAKVSRGGRWKYVTACNYPVEVGNVVDTESDDVIKFRNISIEALLGRCPNEPGVVEFAKKYGIEQSRFTPQTPDGDDCILCGLCVRVCDEVVGAHALGFMDRGPEREVSTPFKEHPEYCIGCGTCSEVCPTTAMKMEYWKTVALKENHGDIRPCRYSLMGFFPGGVCANSYRCYMCDIDQRYREIAASFGYEHPIFMARETAEVGDRE